MKVGIIGLGAMGKVYALRLADAGNQVVACDLPENFEKFQAEFKDKRNIHIVPDGHQVSRQCDYIIYSVEASNIDKVVAKFGPSTKLGACVGGQTSCKAPEIAAFEAHLPPDVEIVSIHSMHGPGVDPEGQPLAIISHRAKKETTQKVCDLMKCFKSTFVHLTAEQHDIITADVQAVTHMAFLTMGTAWKANHQYPWSLNRYAFGLENAKTNIALRIFSNSWHVYAGLAILNPAAHVQTVRYATSITQLFKLMVQGSHKKEEFRQRLYKARDFVFKKVIKNPDNSLLLDNDLLGRFSLSTEPKAERTPNSHLSILGIVDCWYQSQIVPYDHVICSTPLFRILLGVTEYLFMKEGMLDQCVEDAFQHMSYREDDLEFVISARSWATVVSNADFEGYKRMFKDAQRYFEHMLPEATKIGNEMIKAINDHRPPPQLLQE